MATGNEDAKNLALLFFMDHLMQKNGTRTLHDLSCQFGARGFTEEMREAVGSTQEGLLEFLQQFPSLFIVEGDEVSLKGFGEETLPGLPVPPPVIFPKTTTRERDIEKEAIDFFVVKLEKFGPELLIKGLLGHRSQAAPEIRLYSGRHVKEFATFLENHPDHFIVNGDRVRLRNAPEPVEPELEVDEFGQPLVGDRAKEAAKEYLKAYLDTQEAPIPVENLYKEVCAQFAQSVRNEVATNPKELLQFLKSNRSIFFIRSNRVSLVRNRTDAMSDCASETGASMDSSILSVGTGISELAASIVPMKNFSNSDVLQMTTICKTLKSAQEAMQETAAMYTDNRAPCLHPDLANVVAMDFKLVTLDTGHEFLGLVMVGTPFDKLYVFDVANSSSILMESGLKDLLEADDYIKVIHDSKKISTLLWQQYQINVQCVFDTQVANALLQHQRTGRPLHEVKPISFLTLQRLYCPQSLMMRGARKRAPNPDPNYWSLRPLTDEMLRIAVEEVNVLIPVVYMTMNKSLKPELRDLFWHLCREHVNLLVNQTETQSQNQGRPNQHMLDSINEKLLHDPSGSTLAQWEKNLLANAEESDQIAVVQRPSQFVGDLIDVASSFDTLSLAGSCCHCNCHNKTGIDVACQTVLGSGFARSSVRKY